MPESNPELAKVVAYMKSHWPSQVKSEWQVSLEEYPAILPRVVADLTKSATKSHHFFRVAGISGSGKTTQILPAVEALSHQEGISPVLVAARRFVEYHPHYQEIKEYYGENKLRQMTDEFATIMLFLVISTLIESCYDIILDVTLLDPSMEAILLSMLKKEGYNVLILMIATSPVVTEHFLEGRAWRHSKATEQEFIDATTKALEFYANSAPTIRIILWSVYDKLPIYDGPIRDSVRIFSDYSSRTTLPARDDDARRDSKIDYLTKNYHS